VWAKVLSKCFRGSFFDTIGISELTTMNNYDRINVKQKYYDRVEMLIMPTRNEAAIFTTVHVHAPKLVSYLKNNGLRFFPYVLFVCLKTVQKHPSLKRFVLGQKVYDHKRLWISTVIKRNKNDESTNTFVKFELTESMNAHEVQSLLDELIVHTRAEKKHDTDQLMRFLSLLPTFIFSIAIKGAALLDRFDLLPNSVIKADPLHTGLVIANLGSIKGQSVSHHLFNWGTSSMVITIGEFTSEGDVDVTFSVDERIAEGVAFFKAIDTFKHLLENPDEFIA
jgi:chloramphenicol O-acetyltransferase